MAIVKYELTYSEHIDTVSKIRFGNKILEGATLHQDYDSENNKYKNDSISGVVYNGISISVAVEASGDSGGKLYLKVEVDGKKTYKYPIVKGDKNGIYSFSSEYKLRS